MLAGEVESQRWTRSGWGGGTEMPAYLAEGNLGGSRKAFGPTPKPYVTLPSQPSLKPMTQNGLEVQL